MLKDYEILYEHLTSSRDRYRKALKFKTTDEIEGSDKLIGQERAEKSMEFGINIKEKGYNIYISGENGTGRTYYAKSMLENIARFQPVPDDWCYVYNFANKYEPIALSFQAGLGKIFKQDIEYLVNAVLNRIPQVFNCEEYDRQKNEILEDYHDIKNSLLDELNNIAEVNNLQLKATSTGFAFIPLFEGKPMNESEYDNLNAKDKEAIMQRVAEVRAKAIDILRKLKNAEKESDEKVKRLDREIGLYEIEKIVSEVKHKYLMKPEVISYLNSVRDDMLENLYVFINGIDKHSLSKDEDELLLRYRVNLLVDNNGKSGAPVIFETNPTYNNLMGTIEYESKQGTMVTDFLLIRAGSILKANGGYLIVKAEELLKNYQAWEGLKRVLESGQICPEGLRSQLDLIAIAAMKPQQIPVNFKVIMIGSDRLYQLLYELDDDFNEYFKVKVDFDDDMEKNDKNIYKIAQFLNYYCIKNNIRHLECPAVEEIIEYSSKIAGSSNRLTTHFEKIIEIVNESNMWADAVKKKYIGEAEIKKAIREKEKRVSLIEDKMLRQYKENKIMISVRGEAVGQINGLSVIEIGGYSFGKPYRITATTYMGKNGIINIEREVRMSGNIHNKSVMIISGYLGGKYARHVPMSLTAHICFEQLYGYIDGDSASLAELYAVLSSISEVPLRQSIAVTGSINQMGEVQPVGGINEKIIGFYKICSFLGLSGDQGVIIPWQNKDDLLLEDEIKADIKKGMFHIYTIKHAEEGIEILSGKKPGKRDKDGEFEKDSFNYFVDMKLKEFIKNYNLRE